MSADGALRPDLYVGAMGRSGSTLLCNILTVPPNHIVLSEPRFHRPPFRGLLHHQLAELGMPLDEDRVRQVAHLAPADQLSALLGESLARVKWGFKEVLCAEHRAVLELFRPRHVVLCVRNITDVAASFFEKHQTQDNEDHFPVEWVVDYCTRESAQLVDLHRQLSHSSTPLTTVRYEDLTGDPAYLEQLSRDLDWPVGGATHRRMAELNRGFEVVRHGRTIGTAIRMNERSLSNDRIEKAHEIGAICDVYQQHFGYAPPG